MCNGWIMKFDRTGGIENENISRERINNFGRCTEVRVESGFRTARYVMASTAFICTISAHFESICYNQHCYKHVEAFGQNFHLMFKY